MRWITTLLFAGLPAVASASNFSWLLNNSPEDPNKFVWDKRSASVLNQIVPKMKVSNNATPDLAGVVRIDIMLPGAKKIIDQRYVVFSGARPHDAETHGLIWIDTKEGTGAFAVNECFALNSADKCITIGSRSFPSVKLPASFLEELREWLKGESSTLPLRYIDKLGSMSPFELPKK